MTKYSSFVKIGALLVFCTFLSIPLFAMDQVEAKISKMSKQEISNEYHKLFDLSSIQKDELVVRGYSAKEIAQIDRKDFDEIAETWVITDKQVTQLKEIFPELKNTDISGWTNADMQRHSDMVNQKIQETRKPSAEQVAKIQEKGIPLPIAHKMLRDYIDYDTLLAQSEATLNELKEIIVEDEKIVNEFLAYKKAIRETHKNKNAEGVN